MTRAADFGTASLLIDSFPGARLEPLSFLKHWSGLGKKNTLLLSFSFACRALAPFVRHDNRERER